MRCERSEATGEPPTLKRPVWAGNRSGDGCSERAQGTWREGDWLAWRKGGEGAARARTLSILASRRVFSTGSMHWRNRSMLSSSKRARVMLL